MVQNNAFISGEKVFLRALTKEDIEGPWLEWVDELDNSQFIYTGVYPNCIEGHEAYYESAVLSDENIILAICLKQNGRHVGNIGIHDINWLYRSAELGVVLGERAVHGEGAESEAISLIAGHAFNKLNLHKVWVRVSESNDIMLQALRELKFKEEGVLRDEIYLNGEWQNVVQLSLLETEFRE